MFNAWKDLRHLPKPIWFLAISTIINRMGMMVLPYLAIYLTRELHLRPTDAGIVLGLYGFFALIASPIAGLLVDRYGAGRVMVTSLVASTFVLFLFPFAKTFQSVCWVTILFALTNEAFRPANMVMTSLLCPPDRRRQAFALIRLAINLGVAIGPSMGGFLAMKSFLWLFGLNAVASVGSCIVVLVFLVRPMREKFAARTAAIVRVSKEKASLRERWGVADPRVLLAILATIPIGIVFFQNDSTIPLFLSEKLELSLQWIGLIFLVNTLMIVIFEVPLNAMMMHWPAPFSLGLGSLFFAAGFAFYFVVRDPISLGIATALWTIGEMIAMPTVSAYIAERTEERMQGRVMGLLGMAWSFSHMVGPPAGMYLYEKVSVGSVWGMCVALSLVAAGMYFKLERDFSAYRYFSGVVRETVSHMQQLMVRMTK